MSVAMADEHARDTRATAGGTPALPSKTLLPRNAWWWIAILPVVALIAGLVWWMRRPLPPPRITGSKQITSDALPKFALVTDGNRIYFNENPPGRLIISQVASGGGQAIPIEGTPGSPAVSDISADGSELLLNFSGPLLDQPLMAMPLPAGSPRRLGDIMGHDGTWTPSGKLVFGKGNDLYVAEHDGSNAKKLVTAPDIPTSIRVSPDESRIRFAVQNALNNVSALWEIRMDGGGMHPLLPGWNQPAAECCGTWSADGNYYFFQSLREGVFNIWVMSGGANGWRKVSQQPVQLTTGPLLFGNPLPSRDGKRVFVIGVQPRAELVRYDAKSGDFVPYLGGISAGNVEFSRDGKLIVYTSYPEGTLWRSRADGSEKLQLTYPPMQAALVHWSPDGKQIAFSATTPGKPWKVYLMSSDGGSPQAVTSDDAMETDPSWSGDGRTLAFAHYNVLHPEQTWIELFDVGTRALSKLPGSMGIFAPRWSPSGRYIVAITAGGNDKLMLYDVKSEKWRQIKSEIRSFGYLTWSADSNYVYFDTFLSGANGFYRVRISDDKFEKIADMSRLRQYRDQFGPGSWTGLGLGDVPILPRDISTQEIYSFDLELP
jgi:Tol biopolymer transport system component